MPLTPLERKAAFVHEVVMRQKTQTAAAKEDMGVSLPHLLATLAGERVASQKLRQRFADFIRRPVEEIWGTAEPAPDAPLTATAAA